MANGQNTQAIAGRLAEASTWAGLGLVGQNAVKIMANWRDPVAWGGLFAGLAAVFVREKGGGDA